MHLSEELKKIVAGIEGHDSALAKVIADVAPEFEKLEAEIEKLAGKVEEGDGTATVTAEEHAALAGATESVGTKLVEAANVVTQAVEAATTGA